MIKIKPPSYSTGIYGLTLMSLLILSNSETARAQNQNGIDEKRKTITDVKDTIIKLGNHVYAIISDGEAGNVAVYENADGLVLVDDQWTELTPKIKKLLDEVSSKPVKYVLNTHFHYDHADG